jgi:hypothetical protein
MVPLAVLRHLVAEGVVTTFLGSVGSAYVGWLQNSTAGESAVVIVAPMLVVIARASAALSFGRNTGTYDRERKVACEEVIAFQRSQIEFRPSARPCARALCSS